jgi:hypothetical protein
MRLHEFATSDEQLRLWRMVSDAVWASIDSQRQQKTQSAAVTPPPLKKKAVLPKGSPPIKLKKVSVPPKQKPNSSANLPVSVKAAAKSKLPPVPLTPNQRWVQRQKKLSPAPLTKAMGTKIPQNQSNTWPINQKPM